MKLTHILGVSAENAALSLLQKNGLKLIARNWHCIGGELDLIMRDGATLVFVEVRYRSSDKFGGALASVTNNKCRKLRHAAQVYLSKNKLNTACRFDLVFFDGTQAPVWLKNVIV